MEKVTLLTFIFNNRIKQAKTANRNISVSGFSYDKLFSIARCGIPASKNSGDVII